MFLCWCVREGALLKSGDWLRSSCCFSFVSRLFLVHTTKQRTKRWQMKTTRQTNGMSPGSTKWFGNKIVHKFPASTRKTKHKSAAPKYNRIDEFFFQTKVLFIWINFQIVYFAFDSIFMLCLCRSKNNQTMHIHSTLFNFFLEKRIKSYPQSELIN